MAGFLATPQKGTEALSFKESLEQVLGVSVDAETRNLFSGALKQLDTLRIDAVSGHQRLTVGVSLEEALSRYLDGLWSLESLLPPQKLCVQSTWKNAFPSGSIITYHTYYTSDTLSFEKACALFNLAACLSRRAAELAESMREEDLREGIKALQRSAGIFQYIRHVSRVASMTGMTTDLMSDSLQALEKLALGQAQECVYLKAYSDSNYSPTILAKLSQASADLYEASWKHMKKHQPCSDQWSFVIQFKEYAFKGLAQYHQARADSSEKRVGDELARLQLAMEMFVKANKYANFVTILVFGTHWKKQAAVIEQEFKKRHRENDLVYKERITERKDLQEIPAVLLTKTVPPEFPLCAEEPLFEQFKSIFDALAASGAVF
ncbi:apoptosis-linked gene 2-interacting protein X 1 [Galendromus occidentalis]|uniref:Apoptosis-linked gene 2-interacting protein X 1 n=1 Tax=Galendromus occidentalis TaxID=34638 RepID=A0AAJ6QVV6_9ACAR|nr:apoptosis-linked gene 2-interacting protein X 1 [Galendromus occidentalis]